MTIKRISELAGVSTTTVSFVLNDRKGVSESTRKKVIRIIENENYTPNINSRRLTLKRSFNIAFVDYSRYSLFSDFWQTEILKTVVECSDAIGYNIVIHPQLRESDDTSLALSIKQGNVDGVIFFHDISSKLYKDIHDSKIPVVVIDSQMPGPRYPCICVDYEQSAYTAVRHLIECGHKEIAFVGIGGLPDLSRMCLCGFKKAMSESKLPLRSRWLDGKADSEEDVHGVIEKILRDRKTPTAFFCCNDILSVGAIRYASINGYRVPDDISFISIDDISFAKFYNPALTTIHIDAANMGRLAIDMLYSQIEGRLEHTVQVVPSDQLIVRDTVAVLNG